MLSIVTWLWKSTRPYRSQFDAEKVNVLFRMVDRHYPHPHRNLCVTDMAGKFDSTVTCVPAWNDYSSLVSPNGSHNPSCYRRLRAFHPDIADTFGSRFVSLDLDTVIVGELSPLWHRPEEFVIWGETNPRSFYNGSMWLMTAGARRQVWDRFDPKVSPGAAKAAGRFGSDQGWISHVLGQGEATWTTADGVYSYNVHLRNRGGSLPSDARMVMFHGGTDPWSPAAKKMDWVRRHWR